MIDAFLRAAAYLDDKASSAVWDPHQRLSDTQRFAKGQKIRHVAERFRALAADSQLREVHYAEYATLKDSLYAYGLPLALQLDQDIATAIRAARGPAQPITKGWLKLP